MSYDVVEPERQYVRLVLQDRDGTVRSVVVEDRVAGAVVGRVEAEGGVVLSREPEPT